jgi:hypothetical protein
MGTSEPTKYSNQLTAKTRRVKFIKNLRGSLKHTGVMRAMMDGRKRERAH